ncbi:hypothetical protein [Sporolactobacillus pectinivorans]|uniref:hypothetical protein n=1 Tax=Sporolactobacillus pectinivorans TaxID=1591408 RepID=UPI000C261177|nr:hypothetical protein [Sporolactobacillus pectinivorans]
MASLTDYQTICGNFNRSVSASLALPEIAPEGTNVLVESGPIKIEMTVSDGEVKKIVIYSAKAQTPEFDETFEGFEGGLHISDIKLFYAYQESVKNTATTAAVSKNVKVTYITKSTDDLTAIFEVK